MIQHKITWYFWHLHYPNYAERMEVMAHYAKHSEMHKYHVNRLTLAPKD